MANGMDQFRSDTNSLELLLPQGPIPLRSHPGVLELYRYLRLDRAYLYQAILRVFIKHRREYRFYLEAEEVWREVSEVYPDYTLDECRRDLGHLDRELHLLVEHFEAGRRHKTIQSYLHPTAVYRITDEALAIEGSLLRVEQMQGAAIAAAGLSYGDLGMLEALFRDIDELLKREPGPENDRVLADTWRSLASLARRMVEGTINTVENLTRARTEATGADLEAFISYKKQVIDFVRDFALKLEARVGDLQETFFEWERSEATARVSRAMVDYPALFIQQAAPEEWLTAARGEMDSVAQWFRGQEWASRFRKAATSETLALLSRALALASARAIGPGFRRDLEKLAHQLMESPDAEAAAQILAVAFGHCPPRVPGESLSGLHRERLVPWEGRSVVRVELSPVHRGNPNLERSFIPLRMAESQEERRRQELERVAELSRRLERLFGTREVALGELVLMDSQDAHLVLEVVLGCLGEENRRWIAEDGAEFALLNPGVRDLVELRVGNAVYLMRHFRFLRRAGPRALEDVALAAG